MLLTALTLSNTSILIALLRISLDSLILCIGRRHWLRHQHSLESTFTHKQISLPDYQKKFIFPNIAALDEAKDTNYGTPIYISSSCTCRITSLRVKILLTLSSSKDKEFSTGAYIDIEGIGDFNHIYLALPMIVSIHSNSGVRDGIYYKTNLDGTGLHLMDHRDFDKRSDTFRLFIYCTVILPLSQAGANVTLSLPIGSGLRASGFPMTKAEELEYPAKDDKPAETIYLPCIERMELSIGGLPNGFLFDPHGQAPFPEFFSDRECRWISGSSDGFRPHSSISSRLINGMEEERLQMSRIKDGISIGIWTAVFVTVCIDLVWMIVTLLSEILPHLQVAISWMFDKLS